jgi:hypothetical protein
MEMPEVKIRRMRRTDVPQAASIHRKVLKQERGRAPGPGAEKIFINQTCQLLE